MSKLLTNNAVSPTLKIAEIKIQFASLSKKKVGNPVFVFSDNGSSTKLCVSTT